MQDERQKQKPVEEQTLPELLQCFKGEIVYDAHSLSARFARSRAKRELIDHRVSWETLTEVVKHVRLHPITDNLEKQTGLPTALAALIEEMCLRLGMDMETSPEVRDPVAWADWAEKSVQTRMAT